jgi:spermidine/putrescine-binding protein
MRHQAPVELCQQVVPRPSPLQPLVGQEAERRRANVLEARRNNPNVDVIQVGDFLAQEASAKGLLQPIDPARLKNLDQVYDFGRDPLGNKEAIAYTVYSIGLVVRTDKPSAQVASWKDLWRPDLKGHLMLANITGQQGMAQLFMADRAWGGPGTGDMAAGMKKIGELKDNVVTYYAQTAQMTAMFAQDEAWVAPVGRFSSRACISAIRRPTATRLPASISRSGPARRWRWWAPRAAARPR